MVVNTEISPLKGRFTFYFSRFTSNSIFTEIARKQRILPDFLLKQPKIENITAFLSFPRNFQNCKGVPLQRYFGPI